MGRNITRRGLLLGAGALTASTIGLAGCSGVGGAAVGGDTAGGGGKQSVRFAWYGGTERQQAYTKLLDIFEKAHGDIGTEPEYADYKPYQDRLATQLAAGDAPDVFWMTAFNTLEFDKNKQLHELDDLITDGTLDLSGMDAKQVERWRLAGRQVAIPYAYFSPAAQVNLDFLSAAKLDLPDEDSWSWDDFAAICTEFSKKSDGKKVGSAYGAHDDLPFAAWLRQHGQDLFTADGDVGFDADGAGSWIQYWEDLRKAGGALSLSEQEGVAADWEVIAPKVLFKLGNANHLANNQPSVDYELDNLLLPADKDATPGFRYIFFQRFGMYAKTENPVPAATLMSFLLNDPNMPKLVGQNIGMPTNLDLQKVAKDSADKTGTKVLRVIEKEGSFESRPKAEVPPGAGTWRDMMQDTIEAISLRGGSVTAESKKFVTNLQSSIKRARG